MMELAKKVLEFTGSESELIFCDLPQDDPEKRRPCLNLLKTIIPCDSEFCIDDGLKKTIAYFKTVL